MESLFRSIEPLLSLKPESRDLLAAVLKKQEYAKGKLLIRQHTVCDAIYFIEKGLTRTYYIKHGKDVTDWLSPENSFACSIVSFITRTPDIRNVEALEPTVCWVLKHGDLEHLYTQSHEIERLGRLLVSSGLVQVQKRFDDLHFASALERYNILLSQHPGLINRVPLSIIASYLGITQETLSRMRAQI